MRSAFCALRVPATTPAGDANTGARGAGTPPSKCTRGPWTLAPGTLLRPPRLRALRHHPLPCLRTRRKRKPESLQGGRLGAIRLHVENRSDVLILLTLPISPLRLCLPPAPLRNEFAYPPCLLHLPVRDSSMVRPYPQNALLAQCRTPRRAPPLVVPLPRTLADLRALWFLLMGTIGRYAARVSLGMSRATAIRALSRQTISVGGRIAIWTNFLGQKCKKGKRYRR